MTVKILTVGGITKTALLVMFQFDLYRTYSMKYILCECVNSWCIR